ncbi:MAG: hypothetical protein M3400_08165, partial [Actinomycetota bacterium]|nr:hypothetical protein [Actinomycetota bacterium]
RAEPGSGRTMVLGPLDTNDLSAAERDDLVGLVRQSRLFDLPASLPRPDTSQDEASNEPLSDEITIAVRAGERSGTVSYVVAQPRPQELDELLRGLEARMPWEPVIHEASPPLGQPPAAVTEFVRQPEAFAPYVAPPDPAPRQVTDPAEPFTPVTPFPPVIPTPGSRPRSRRRLVAALAAALLVIAGGLTAFVIMNDSGGEPGGGTSTAPSESAQAGSSGSASTPPSSSALGLPTGPPLPESMLVAAHDSEGNIDLYTVDSTTGATQTRLTSEAARDTQPLISPDRTSVIFLSRADDVSLLWVVGSDGSGARPLFETSPPGCDQVRGRAAWNPADPTMLAVVCLDAGGAATLQLLTPWGGRIRTLETGLGTVGGPSFSPDGTGLVYWGNADPAATEGSLFRLQTAESTAPVQLTDPADVGAAESPTWSPDGTRIAFHVVVDAQSSPPNTEIVVMDADGSNPVQLAPSDGVDQDPTWSPDGSMIAFKSDRTDGSGERVQRLWIMSADGTGTRLLTTEDVQDGFDAAW